MEIGMRYRFYREHKLLCAMLFDLQQKIAKADFTNNDEIKKIEQDLTQLMEILHSHAQYEEERLHELLREKNCFIFETIEKDHLHHDQVARDMFFLLESILSCTNDEQKIEQGYKFYLHYRKFVADTLMHFNQEETVIMPELQRLYSDEELQDVEAPSYNDMTEDDIAHMLLQLFPHMNANDREAFLSDIKRLEPKKFKVAWVIIAKTINPKEKDRLEKVLIKS